MKFRYRSSSLTLRVLALGCCLGVGVATGLAGCGDRTTDVEHVQRAREYQAKQEWPASVIELKNALQKNPENRDARLLLGQIYVETGNGAPAEKELQRARELGAERSAWLLPLARSYLLQGQNQKVLELTPEASDPPATQATLLALHGLAGLALGQPDAAKTSLDQALERQPDDPDALLGMSQLALLNRNYSEAEAFASKASERNPQDVRPWFIKVRLHRLQNDDPAALKALQRILDLQSGNAAALLERAQILIAQGKQGDAFADVEMVRKRQPNLPEANYLRGNLLFQKKDLVAAQEALLQVLKVAPEHPGAQFLLGSINYEQGNLGQADQYLTSFINRLPGYLPARLLLAATQLKLEKPGQAIDTLIPALAQTPDDAQLLALLGSAYLQNHDYAKGSEYLQKAAQITPDATNIRTQLALSRLGEGKADEAVRELQGLVDLGQDVLQADLLLVQAYLQQKEYDKAITAAAELVKRKPDDPIAHNLLGGAYLAKGEDEQARSEFEQALRLNADFSTPALNLALLELKAGNRAAAQALYEKVIAKEPGNLTALLRLAGLTGQAGQTEQALHWLEQAWDKNPASLEAGLALIGQYQKAGLNLKALNVARGLETANPEHPAAERALGLVLLADGRPDEAIKAFQKLAELQPQAPEPWHLLALTQARSQNFQAAAAAIDKALAVQGDYLPSLVARVELQAQQGKFQEALTGAKDLQKRFPNLNVGYRLEGNLYVRQKDFTKALAAYQAAYAKTPDSQTVSMLAGAQQVTGDSEAALKTLRDWLAAHPDDVQVRTRLATELQRLGRREEAIAEYERLAKREPGDEDSGVVTLDHGLQQADTLLVQAYLQQKEFDKAIAVAKELTEKRPNEPAAFNLLGAVYLAKGDDDEAARAAFEQALKLKPDHVSAQMNLAALETKAGNRAGAQLRYRQILERDPDNLAALVRLAALLGRTDESLRLLEQAWNRRTDSVEAGLALMREYVGHGDKTKALAVVETLVAAKPDDPRVVRALGLTQVNNGKTAEAVTSFKKLAVLSPQSPEPWYLVAMAQNTAKDTKSAIESLDKALTIQNNYLPALVAKVQLQQQGQEIDKALDGIRNIQTLYPDQVTGHVLEGDLYLRQQEFIPAVAAYQAAYAKTPNSQTALRLASAQWQAGDREAALATLRQWLTSEPKDNRARLQYAMYLQVANRKTETIAEYEQLAERLPDNAVVLNNLAWYYYETGDARALRYAERAHDKAPDNPEIADTLGWILVQRDEALRGLEFLQAAASKLPDQPSIRYHLAAAYAKLGRKDAARQELKKLAGVSAFPEQEEARQLLENLGEQEAGH
ncbi:MAG: PEP-CTERM system TPR-repeat protein PrsT [Gammaproteobacteria bacterium]|nr:PEP-CTERM system TPR-repeat protein PrsT [Gammaproteobacteria bacterium]MCP5196426.1 PEP-CTERM system TPR-repeat protein PrsT [Gammaproteobacteria bacterium]